VEIKQSYHNTNVHFPITTQLRCANINH